MTRGGAGGNVLLGIFALEKKCLEIRKFAKFQSDLLKTNEDIARPQSREILQTFVWWGSGTVLVPPLPPTSITYKRQ